MSSGLDRALVPKDRAVPGPREEEVETAASAARDREEEEDLKETVGPDAEAEVRAAGAAALDAGEPAAPIRVTTTTTPAAGTTTTTTRTNLEEVPPPDNPEIISESGAVKPLLDLSRS